MRVSPLVLRKSIQERPVRFGKAVQDQIDLGSAARNVIVGPMGINDGQSALFVLEWGPIGCLRRGLGESKQRGSKYLVQICRRFEANDDGVLVKEIPIVIEKFKKNLTKIHWLLSCWHVLKQACHQTDSGKAA